MIFLRGNGMMEAGFPLFLSVVYACFIAGAPDPGIFRFDFPGAICCRLRQYTIFPVMTKCLGVASVYIGYAVILARRFDRISRRFVVITTWR